VYLASGFFLHNVVLRSTKCGERLPSGGSDHSGWSLISFEWQDDSLINGLKTQSERYYGCCSKECDDSCLKESDISCVENFLLP